MKTLSLLLLLVLAIPPKTLENPCGTMLARGGDEDWGKGIIILTDSAILNLYSPSEHEVVGQLQRDGRSYFALNEEGDRIKIDSRDMEYVGYIEIGGPKAKYTLKKDYFQIFWKGIEGGAYLKKEEIEASGSYFVEYKDFLFKEDINPEINQMREFASMGINLTNSCLNLREGPSTNHKKIQCISGNSWEHDDFYHLEIFERKGNWVKVEVTHTVFGLSDEPGSDCLFIEKGKMTGWVKALDDSGFPNVWYSVTSY